MAHSIVIFGASGDLTSRKLIPALYLLFRKNRLPDATTVVGLSRSEFSHEQWRKSLAKSTAQFVGKEFDTESWSQFATHLYYQRGDIDRSEDFIELGKFLESIECGDCCTRLYYLATLPSLYERAVEQLGTTGLADKSSELRRIVIEKPFGNDLNSARLLNQSIHDVFHERQVYRIDHYLGKESVQNLLVLRFANSIFEPIWNRNYIDHVQITVAEEVSVGNRGSYYDSAGILRDMFQNHLLQLMTITAMEAPSRFQADLIRDEKVKVLRAVRPIPATEFDRNVVLGRYAGYLDEEGVQQESQTATFASIKLLVDNWRWNGVPFYLRSGKAMSCRTTQIVIQFREPPHLLFDNEIQQPLDANRLVIQIQPAEGIQLHFQTKVPDAGMKLRMTDLDFRFSEEYSGSMPDAYQRLLLDAFNGDASLFARSDEVEQAWSIIDPIVSWQSQHAPPVDEYALGDWGPNSSFSWMNSQGRQWFDVCPVLH